MAGSLLAATLLTNLGCGESAPYQGSQAAAEASEPKAEVIAAWEKAGTEFHWMEQLSGAVDPKNLAEGFVPGFRFKLFPTGKLNVLPQLEVPFGLGFESVTDEGLK